MNGSPMLRLALAAIAFVAAFAIGSWAGRSRTPIGVDASGDPIRARIVRALDERDAIHRVASLTRILDRADAETRAIVVEELEQRLRAGAPLPLSALELVAEVWATEDLQAALRGVADWPGEGRSAGRTAIFRALARRSPQQAFVAAGSLPADEQAAARRGFFEGLAEVGDRDAWRYLASMPSTSERELLTNIVMKSVIWREGFASLYEQVESISTREEPGSPRDYKLSALRTAVGLGGYFEPEQALAFARRFAGGPYDNNLLRRVAIHWVMTDPPRAMEAMIALPADPQRDRALRDAYRIWLRRAHPDAVAWMPEAIVREPRYAVLAEQYGLALARQRGDRSARIREAIAWSERVEDPALRQRVQIQLGAEWMNREPEAATAWVAERGLTASVADARRGPSGAVGKP